eukprot:8639918-Lingulodinium_polyedra.AAC.1
MLAGLPSLLLRHFKARPPNPSASRGPIRNSGVAGQGIWRPKGAALPRQRTGGKTALEPAAASRRGREKRLASTA